jgi:hypothetical protein
MKLCPSDLKPCCDDLCHGGGCLQEGGEPMVEVCQHCGQPIIEDEGCECDPTGYDDDDCLNCGVCEWCIERTRDSFEEGLRYEEQNQ